MVSGMWILRKLSQVRWPEQREVRVLGDSAYE